MSQLSSAITAGPCCVFRSKAGREYPVAYKTQKVKAAYCDWLEERARERLLLRKEREEMSRAQWERVCDSHEEDVIAGKFEFDSQLVWKSLQTPTGSMKMAALLFGVPLEEMRQLIEESEEEIALLLRKVELESSPRRTRGNDEQPMEKKAEKPIGTDESASTPSLPA